VKATVQYGPSILARALYLHGYQLLPHARFCHLRTNYLPTDAQKNDSGLVVPPLERGFIVSAR
jgi:hypothetical protein